MMYCKIIATPKEPRILIIEDNNATADVIYRYLSYTGLSSNIESVRTLAEATNAINTQEFDLILADKSLPDGETLKLIRKSGILSEQPILVVTGDLNMTLDDALQRGALGIVHKPLEKSTFIDACKTTLKLWPMVRFAREQKIIAERQARTLKCYNELAQLFDQKNLTAQTLIDQILEIIQNGIEDSDNFAIRIMLNGANCQTDNFTSTDNQVDYPIVINGDDIKGSIVVSSLKARPDQNDTSLPKELKLFLNDTAKRIGTLYERNEAVRMITKDKVLFEAIFESSGNPKIILDQNGQVLMANHAAVSFPGVDEDSIIGQPFVNLNWSLIPGQQQNLSKAIRHALDGLPTRFDYYCQNAQNVCTHFMTSLVPVLLGRKRAIILEATDNTEYKNLLHQVLQHKKMVMGTSDAYVGMDLKGSLTPINPAWETITGYPLGNIDITETLPQTMTTVDDAHIAKQQSLPFDLTEEKETNDCLESAVHINQLLSERSLKPFWVEVSRFFRWHQQESRAVVLGDFELVAEDGSLRFVSISIMPHTQEKRLIGYILNIHDNTEIQHKNMKIQEQNEKLKILADRDQLTQLYNRRAAWDRIRFEFENARRYNRNIGMIMMDLDFFKKVNDTYGHNAGDYVLIETARIIQECIRKVDLVARWGGEEFLLLLPDINTEQAKVIAERVRSSIESFKFEFEGQVIPVTASLGIGTLDSSDINPEDETSEEQLINSADQALYHSKENGRNRITLAT